MPRLAAQMLTLLKRVVAAGKADRWLLREVCPRDVAQFDRPLEHLLESDLAERVTEGCGRWFYRLTQAGLDAARTGQLPRARKWQYPDDHPEPHGELGYATGSGRRLHTNSSASR